MLVIYLNYIKLFKMFSTQLEAFIKFNYLIILQISTSSKLKNQ